VEDFSTDWRQRKVDIDAGVNRYLGDWKLPSNA